jgi:MoaA/NifB/PqqE/SkfB family radical SAM enzyme
MPPGEMSVNMVVDIITMLKELGCRAITLSGGGEPTMHKNFNHILELLLNSGIKIGLITNGLRLGTVAPTLLRRITWVRISQSVDNELTNDMKDIVDSFPEVCWSFRYVATEIGNGLAGLIQYCIAKKIVLYITNDIFSSSFEHPEVPEDAKNIIVENKNLNIQSGQEHCLIGLLKPHFAVDGYVYPCCLVGMPDQLLFDKYRMCHYKDYPKMVTKQAEFNGSVCRICYFDGYNCLLNAHKSEILHKEFC